MLQLFTAIQILVSVMIVFLVFSDRDTIRKGEGKYALICFFSFPLFILMLLFGFFRHCIKNW